MVRVREADILVNISIGIQIVLLRGLFSVIGSLDNVWFLRRTVTVLAADIADNAQINENRGVEAGKLAEHDETRYL